jgi:hypothetical protein
MEKVSYFRDLFDKTISNKSQEKEERKMNERKKKKRREK